VTCANGWVYSLNWWRKWYTLDRTSKNGIDREEFRWYFDTCTHKGHPWSRQFRVPTFFTVESFPFVSVLVPCRAVPELDSVLVSIKTKKQQ
jgi:hypothetical protein